ncbi:MAG: hypothetical protein AAF790_14560, partial [Planctomycetota bacterium]
NPDRRWLNIERLQSYLFSGEPALQTEAVRTLAAQSNPRRVHLLAKVASDASLPDSVRADAVAGLAAFVDARRPLLEKLSRDEAASVRREATRVLRLAETDGSPGETKPQAGDTDAWLKLLGREPGDAESGRRLFYSTLGARCARCHRHTGRGSRIGPELTRAGQELGRRRLLESILQPSLEIAPQHQAWVLQTDAGQTLTGLRVPQAGDNGVERYNDANGRIFALPSSRIDERSQSPVSLMPAGLERLISVQDFRDLLAFLGGHD